MRETVIIHEQYNMGHICTQQQCDNELGDKLAKRRQSPRTLHLCPAEQYFKSVRQLYGCPKEKSVKA
jgi:hypothetical protein